MNFCPRCGTSLQGAVCQACGFDAANAAPPPAPSYTAPQPPAYGTPPLPPPLQYGAPQPPQYIVPPPRKKISKWWWIALGLVIWVSGTAFFYYDNEKKFAEARNTGVDILSTDAKTGVVTARDRKTGKIITMNMGDIEPDQVDLNAALGKLPEWMPAYPNGSTPEEIQGGTFSLETPDAAGKAAAFYVAELKKAGMSVKKTASSKPPEVTLAAADAKANRNATIAITVKGTGSAIEITARGR